jgi:hypothetical protein
LAGYFLLTYNWVDQPVKIGFVNPIARVWMSFRPGLPFPPPDSDVTAGVVWCWVGSGSVAGPGAGDS